MEALYRKYRPTTFSDVVGQEHIERTLKNAIEQDKVSHAYLFCGPRGTGKTTMARILAKALLCEKGPTTDPDGTCSECEAIAQGTHPDVYELDAASRTGVDNVREEIISRVNYAPTRGAWKVYIIDEAHMLSMQAFNALLKTLEEPPAHVMFILCTTDPQQVPGTIQSRCQRFDFHRISNEAIVSRLGAICVEEGVDFEGEALDLIAYRAEGGMRNALTSLEQLIAFGDGHVTLEGAQNLLGSLDETDLSEIVLAIGRRDAAACFNWVARYVETGADLAQFVRDLAEYIRNMYLLSIAGIEVEIHVNEAVRKAMVDQLKLFGEDRLSRLLLVLGDLSKELRTSSNPRLSFEIALTRMIRPDSDITIEALAERVEELERKLESGQIGVSTVVAQGAMPAQPTVPTQAVATQQAAVEPPTASHAASSAPIAPPAMQPQASPAATPAVSTASATSSVPVTPAASATATSPVAPMAAQVPSTPAPSMVAQVPPAPVPSAPASSASAAPQATIDLTNPAAVQRFWHAVTTSLRKSNPARGVLFMNAKVAGETNGNGLVVTFAKDNGFAYTAAQKPEVQQLLAQTIESVAGGHVPYRLVLEAGGEGDGPAATTTVSPSFNSPLVNSQPDGVPSGTSNNSGVAAQADRVRAAVQAAQEAARAAQARKEPEPIQPPSMHSQASTLGGNEPVVASYDDDDDRVPLEAYGDAFYSEDNGADANVAEAGSAASSSMADTSIPQTASPINEPVLQADTSTDSSAVQTDTPTGDEASRIKSILSNSFGEGIKFEEL
ncbi:dNA polymerase III subunit gamma/tau [Eggerthella sp. CAG:1427]|nr:dNA polymerase III subunit gamma/tau [Eggerthella sp. CAG:1427]